MNAQGQLRPLLLATLLGCLLAAGLALRPNAVRAPQNEPAVAVLATAQPAMPSSTPSLSPSPTVTSTPTPIPTPQLSTSADTSPLTISLQLQASVPGGATEALLWYDTPSGHALRSFPLAEERIVRASHTITRSEELARACDSASACEQLDYWWGVRDSSGMLTRRGGTVALETPLITHSIPISITAPITWVERLTPHFRLYAVPGSDAARDLDQLTALAEASYTQASTFISTTATFSITVYLVPRVFWQGGVAHGAEGPLLISYLDRNYIGVEPWSYFVHEVTHALGGRLLPRESEVGGLLGEGIAVYTSGGHYGLEPIDAWAAALAASERYLPLCELRYDFYSAHHEVAYTEAASFTSFLIERYGHETFTQLYIDQRPQRGQHRADLATFCAEENQQIAAPTGKTNAELEQEWLAYLATLAPTEDQKQAWELTIRFFDTMRHYQTELDPPARLLPPPPDVWEPQMATAMLTPASSRSALALELMLQSAGESIRRGEVEQSTALLHAIEASIAASGALTGTLTQDYVTLIELFERQARALRLGDQEALAATLGSPALATRLPFRANEPLHDLRYIPIQLDIQGKRAQAVVEVNGASLTGHTYHRALFQVELARTNGEWRFIAWEPYRHMVDLPPTPEKK